MTTETTFGGWLRQQRRQLDWTQVELAQRVGYSVATIRKLERDELHPSKRLAELLAQALEVAVTQHASLVSFARATPTQGLEPDTQPLHEQRRSNLPAQLTRFFWSHRRNWRTDSTVDEFYRTPGYHCWPRRYGQNPVGTGSRPGDLRV